jgi:hypothetical protein
MYYYLFEPAVAASEVKKRRIASLIHLHGITGEMASPSATASLEDLVTRAADKGFNTIVAVGGDVFITDAAKLLARSDIAFGAIPVDASAAMHDVFGVTTTDQAIISLKQRKVTEASIGIISPGKVFLTGATITSRSPIPITVESKTFRADGTFTELIIEREDRVAVRFHDRSMSTPPVKRLLFWLVGRQLPETAETVLRAPMLTLTTPEALPVLSLGQELAKTPCKVRVVPGALKLIQARATLSSDQTE